MSDAAAQHQLWAALASGDSLRIREQAATDADVNLPIGNPGGETPLIRAVASGDLAMVRLLIELGADVNLPWKGPKSWTPLMFAHESPEMLQVSPTDKPVRPPSETPKAPSEYRCPNCHALIYSRKPKICGQCGALLPPELLLTEPEVQALTDERGWARELADKLITQSASPPQATAHPRPNSNLDKTPAESFSPEDLLRRDSSAEQFKYRDRPAFWLYVVGYAVFFFAIGFVALKLRMMPSAGLLAMTALFAFLCFRAWHIASPVCPNCKQNIRLCARQYCQLCGQPLKNQRCNGCGVDYSWTAFLPPNSRRGNFGWIKFCPGCGVRLDAKVGR